MPRTQHVGSISDSNTTKRNSNCPNLVSTFNTTARCAFKMAGPIPRILTNTSLPHNGALSFGKIVYCLRDQTYHCSGIQKSTKPPAPYFQPCPGDFIPHMSTSWTD